MRSAQYCLSAIALLCCLVNGSHDLKDREGRLPGANSLHLLTSNQTPGSKPPGPYLWELLPNLDKPVPKMVRKQRAVSRMGNAKYISHRLSNRCDFPLDVIILQDATASFDDNIDAMRDVQIDLIHDGITASHPSSRFSIISFKDKPLWPLGDRNRDHCTSLDTTLDNGVDHLVEAYQNLTASGGADAPENQFGALYNVLSNQNVGWAQDEGVTTKLVIISTDAGPHFGGDSTSHMLPEFTPNFTDDHEREICLTHHYPTTTEMKELIEFSHAYVAFLIYDGDWANGWAAKSWKAFNTYIGQASNFVASQAPDSSDFWLKLARIINEIENIECELDESTSTDLEDTTANADTQTTENTDTTNGSEASADLTDETSVTADESESTGETDGTADLTETEIIPQTETTSETDMTAGTEWTRDLVPGPGTKSTPATIITSLTSTESSETDENMSETTASSLTETTTNDLTTKRHKTTTPRSTASELEDHERTIDNNDMTETDAETLPTCVSTDDESENPSDCTVVDTCKCPCDHCTCCPEMVIQFKRKPKQMHLAVIN